jgi:hypothetical protein
MGTKFSMHLYSTKFKFSTAVCVHIAVLLYLSTAVYTRVLLESVQPSPHIELGL